MRLLVTRAAPLRRQPLSWLDRVAFAVIWGAALICFALLAWGHLGLGALIVPPAATAYEQTTTAGPYRVTMQLDSGHLTARGPNAVSFVVTDRSSHPVEGATLVVASSMATMSMDAPAVGALAQGHGRYEAHPVFAMAGEWNVRVGIAMSGQPQQAATFPVGVRWNS